MLFAATIKELQHDYIPFMLGVLRQIGLLIVTQQAGKFSKPPQNRYRIISKIVQAQVHAFFMRVYFIRIFMVKLAEKLRMSQEYRHHEFGFANPIFYFELSLCLKLS